MSGSCALKGSIVRRNVSSRCTVRMGHATQLHPLVQRALSAALQAENLLKGWQGRFGEACVAPAGVVSEDAKICEEMVAAYKSRTVSKMVASIRQQMTMPN